MLKDFISPVEKELKYNFFDHILHRIHKCTNTLYDYAINNN